MPTRGPIPCLVFALAREAMFFRPRRRRPAPCRACLAGPPSDSVLILETGVGAQAMIDGLSWVLRDESLSFVLLAGFSGALVPGLKVGDLLLASELTDQLGNTWPATWPSASPDFPRGRLLTTAGLIGEPADKAFLAARHQAIAVDMESAHAARLCHNAGVPFGCLRVISDDVETRLPGELVQLLNEGRASPTRLMAALLRKPSLLPILWRLGSHTRHAARELAHGLEMLLHK